MQQPQQHHHHKPKPSLNGSSPWIRRSPPPSPPHKKKPWGAGGRSRYACRLVPLLVLTVYSLFTVLRIPSSSLVVSTADSGARRPPVPFQLDGKSLSSCSRRRHGYLLN